VGTLFLPFETVLLNRCAIGILPFGLGVTNIGGGSVAGAAVIVGFDTVGSNTVGYWPKVVVGGGGVMGRSAIGSTGSGAGPDATLCGLTWCDGTDAGAPTGLRDASLAGDTMKSIAKMSLSMRKKFDFRLCAARTSRSEQ